MEDPVWQEVGSVTLKNSGAAKESQVQLVQRPLHKLPFSMVSILGHLESFYLSERTNPSLGTIPKVQQTPSFLLNYRWPGTWQQMGIPFPRAPRPLLES
jgi:hypothetical protein